MSLRGRLTLLIITSFVTLTLVLLIEGHRREAVVDARLEATQLLMLEVSWAGFAGAEEQRLLSHYEAIRRTPEILESFTVGSDRGMASATVGIRADLRETEFQAIRLNGAPIYDTRGSETVAALPRETVQSIARSSEAVSGLMQTQDGELVFAIAEPVIGTRGGIGVAMLWSPVDLMLTNVSEAIVMPTAIVGAEEILGSAHLDDLMGDDLLPTAVRANTVEYHKRDDRTLHFVAIGLADSVTDLPLTLLAVEDVTEDVARRDLLSGISYLALASAMILFFAVINWSLRTSFRPLDAIIQSLDALTKGRTDLRVAPPTRRDEIGRLAGTFETFRQGMEARTRLGRLTQELEVATRIQNQVLPRAFPSVPRVDFAASMIPMREVGGDFYDVFALPDGRIGLVIADVSDKGVGAALFMAIARTAVRSTAMSTPDPAECVRRVNEYLCDENEAMLFVTLVYSVLDPATGALVSCNAGHNPPARIDQDGTVTLMEVDPQPVLGILEGTDYVSETSTLAAGDSLFFYTDGVTEAMTADGEEFGEDHLVEALGPLAKAPPDEMISQVLAHIEEFVAGNPANDDITCLAVSFSEA